MSPVVSRAGRAATSALLSASDDVLRARGRRDGRAREADVRLRRHKRARAVVLARGRRRRPRCRAWSLVKSPWRVGAHGGAVARLLEARMPLVAKDGERWRRNSLNRTTACRHPRGRLPLRRTQ
jgi:hypothetical protein